MRQDLLEGRDCLHLSLEVFPKVKKDARVSIVILSLQEGIKHRALWASPNIIDLKIEKNSSYLFIAQGAGQEFHLSFETLQSEFD